MENSLLRTTGNIVKESSKGLATIVLGFLPEQEALAKRIKWYDPDKGVSWSSILEAYAGIGIAIAFDTQSGKALIGLGLGSEAIFYRLATKSYSTDVLGYQTKKEDYERMGSLVLEIPYRIAKNSLKTLTRIVKH